MAPPVPGSAELSHSILTSLGFSCFLLGPVGSSLKHAEFEPESFGIVVCRLMGIVQDILGWVWPGPSFSSFFLSGFVYFSFSPSPPHPSPCPHPGDIYIYIYISGERGGRQAKTMTLSPSGHRCPQGDIALAGPPW